MAQVLLSGRLRSRWYGCNFAMPAGTDRPGHTRNSQPGCHADIALPRLAQRDATAHSQRRRHYCAGEVAGSQNPDAGNATLAAESAAGPAGEPVRRASGALVAGHTPGRCRLRRQQSVASFAVHRRPGRGPWLAAGWPVVQRSFGIAARVPGLALHGKAAVIVAPAQPAATAIGTSAGVAGHDRGPGPGQ